MCELNRHPLSYNHSWPALTQVQRLHAQHRAVSPPPLQPHADNAAPALQPYLAKRNFAVTPEPAGGDALLPAGDQLIYVIQKHWASSLHYDFRLQWHGSLKSWAVPKGPSLDPRVKRMAVEVEDHPLAYASFEGVIPAKQYGAGQVIVWDAGVWMPLVNVDDGLRQGNLKFELQGHKLQGRWALVRMKQAQDRQRAWLLIKEKDSHVRPASEFDVVDAMPDSVLTAMHLAKAAKPANPGWTANKTEPKAKASAQPSQPPLPAQATRAALPATLRPALATLVASAPARRDDWLFEIKFDGYRMLARVDGTKVALHTRNGQDWSAKLPHLVAQLQALQLPPGWYDGEIVLPDQQGLPDFGALQASFDSGNQAEMVFHLFDLPFVHGHDLRAVPLVERRALLQQLLQARPSDKVRFSAAFEVDGASMLASACHMGLEGVIGKRRTSTYPTGRSTDWIKLKCGQRQEFVIGGYTAGQGARAALGALLLGVHEEGGALRYVGDVGTGFSQAQLATLLAQLQALSRDSSPFDAGPAVVGRPRWVQPRMLAEVSFAGWTRAGRLRHAVFRGLRNDKPAAAVVRERPVQVKAVQRPKPATMADDSARPTRAAPGIRLTHPERVIDPHSGLRKQDLVAYYQRAGALMLPHLKARPLAWLRAPSGVQGQQFFQKHTDTAKLPGVRQLAPAMMEMFSAAGLLYAAQWNVIEFHTANRTTRNADCPDRMVFDLDPGAGVPWVDVQEAAELMRVMLAHLGLPAFLKTSGGKGLHVVVPLRAVHGWAVVKGFSQAVVQHMARTIGQRFVAKSGPRNRVGKIFIDYLRNGPGATTVAAWSARARPGLGISVPVAWEELPMLSGGDQWTVATADERLAAGNEPWAGYGRAACSLHEAMAALDYAPAEA